MICPNCARRLQIQMSPNNFKATCPNCDYVVKGDTYIQLKRSISQRKDFEEFVDGQENISIKRRSGT